MRRTMMTALAALLLVGASAGSALADSHAPPITPDAIYADGRLFGTIGLNPLPFNDNPHAFDMLYLVREQQAVAEASPGRDYNGGRWVPVPVTWNTTPYLLTSDDAVHQAAMAGDVTIGAPQYDATFLCPLIRGPGRA